MKPIKFKEADIIYAENQPEYTPLPAYISDSINNPRGDVIFCMGLSFRERIKLLFTGKIWVSLRMFRDKQHRIHPLTPSFLSVHKTDFQLKKHITIGDLE